ncbi:hypothetical protein FPRO05_02518 [Fusarium proliferatum]|uniref:Uncharacterized protein n=1 Tax=Gibberella intermedia TaxID=948311 RepID=A0A365MYZ7_GIBIN|nr:hypothetical protein FPRO05_02518 [Fusarium proliferatum]
MRKNTEKLRQAIAKQEHKETEATAKAAASSAQASTIENVTEAATEAATNASASDAKDTTGETETPRCKHRHLPVSLLPLFFPSWLSLHAHRIVTTTITRKILTAAFLPLIGVSMNDFDDNIAKGRAAMDTDYRSHNDVLRRTRERLARHEQEIQRTLRLGLRSMELEVKHLKWRVDEIQQENQTLRDEIEHERRRTRRMMLELYESSDSQETDHSD